MVFVAKVSFAPLFKTMESKGITSYQLQKMGFKFNLKEVVFDLYKIAVFDSLTAQSDRHIENTFFII